MIKLSVSIDVPDLTKAEHFYVEALGCKKIRNQGDKMQGDKMIVLSTDNAEIYLQECKTDSVAVKGSDIKRTYERHWTPVHLEFLRNDVNEVVAKVKQSGGEYDGGESGDWGSIAHCVDPFGNGFCIINE